MDDARAAVAGVFDRAAGTYDAVGVEFFATVGRQLVEDAAVRAGDRVLDLGCGRGAVLFPAAERVGPRGVVMGVDLAPTMVDLTARDIADRGIANASVQVMDVQEPTLPEASYDVVTASLVIFFLPDPAAALRAWHGLLVSGGRLGFTTFTGEDDPRWSWLEQVFATEEPPASQRPPDEDSPFRSTDRVHDLLVKAGFVDPTSTVRPMSLEFADPEQWLAWSWSAGMRARWEKLSEQRRTEARAESVGHLEEMREQTGRLELRMSIRHTVARA